VGFSNGGMMCYRLAAERSATFASVAAMSASIGGDPDPGDPSSAVHVNDPALYGADPVSILHVHGLADTHAPFSGGPMDRPGRTRADVPVVDELAMWAGHDGCDADRMWR